MCLVGLHADVVRRTNMLMSCVAPVDDWSTFELTCDVMQPKVDLAVGAWVGVQVNVVHCPSSGKLRVDQPVLLWNLPPPYRNMTWNVAHPLLGAYELWLRFMWWLQGANQGQSFATHVSVNWSSPMMQT